MTAPHLSLEDISDRIQIQDLLTRYALAIDNKDWALLDTCFAAGAQIDYTSTGGEKGPYSEVREWLKKVLSSFAVTVHFLGNTSVELEGERARAHAYLWNPMGFQKPDGSLHWFTVSAQYRDELVRTSDGWRIQRRVQERGVIIGALPGRDS